MSRFIAQQILAALPITIMLMVLSAMVAAPVAFGVGLARIAPIRVVRIAATAYVEVFRGSSALVQLFWAFYVLPFLGIDLDPIAAGVAVLGLNAGAYASEIVRGAVVAVPKVQWEAATALNLSRTARMVHVVLPQAVPAMLPTFGNVLIDILKGTAILSLITITELTRTVDQLAVNGEVTFDFGYTLLLVMYFILSLPLMGLIRAAEKFTGRHLVGAVRTN